MYHHHRLAVALGWLASTICGATAAIALLAPAAEAGSGFGGTATYTGSLGPVSVARNICICVSADPNLSNILGCIDVTSNGGTYTINTRAAQTYYLVGFLDLNANIALDPGEPLEIYDGKSMPPGDPVTTGPAQLTINFRFGDESLALSPTPTSAPLSTDTATPPAAPTATPSPTSSPRRQCAGDCDGSGDVTVNELVVLVNIALGNAPLASCAAGDADRSTGITINEIVAAVHAALGGCT